MPEDQRHICLAGVEENMGTQEDKLGKVCESQGIDGLDCQAVRAFIYRPRRTTNQVCDTGK